MKLLIFLIIWILVVTSEGLNDSSSTKKLLTTTAANNDSRAIVTDTILSTNTTVSNAGPDSGFPGYAIAIIVVLVILIILAIVGALIYFLIFKDKDQEQDVARQNKPPKISAPKEATSNSDGFKLPSLIKKKNTLPPIDNNKSSKPKDGKNDSGYTLSTEGNWRSSGRKGQENKSYTDSDKPAEQHRLESPEYNGGVARGAGRLPSFNEGKKRESGFVPGEDLDEKRMERNGSQRMKNSLDEDKEREEEDNF